MVCGHLELIWRRYSPWNQSSSECSITSLSSLSVPDCWVIRWESGSGRSDLLPFSRPRLSMIEGILITFVQFVVTALVTWPTYFSASCPPCFLRRPQIPLIRLIVSASMFFTVNMLNNFAFGYNISVPVHIILRSGGSVMTMLVGYAWGKRYTSVQGESLFVVLRNLLAHAVSTFSLQRSDAHNWHCSGSHG